MTSAPRVSVVVPTYNRMRLLDHTLRSLTRQSLPRERFEVLVVDDGSSDETPAVVESYRSRLPVRYFRQEDLGFRVAAARNVGITYASGDICVFVDSGVLLHSGCLAAHLAAHDSSDEPLALSGYVYCFDLDDADAARMRQVIDVHDPDATIARLAGKGTWLDIREGFYARYGDDFHHLPAPWLMFWCCNASARTEQMRAVGMFDEAFRSWGGEDLDLAYRLHRDGARVMVDRRATAIHYPHEKDHDANMRGALANYRYMADKYRTPIVQVLTELPDIDFGMINEIIRERGLPRCADYLARTRVGGAL